MWKLIKLYFSKVWEFLWPLIFNFLKDEAPIIIASVLKAVMAVELMPKDQLKNGSKMDTAIPMIVLDLKLQAVPASLQFIKECVEAAVRKLFPNDESITL